MLRQRSLICIRYIKCYFSVWLLLLLSITTTTTSNIIHNGHFITASTTSITSHETKHRDRRRMSTVTNTFNSLVKSASTTKFNCDTSYEALVAMNVPNIQFVTNWSIEITTNNTGSNNNTNTEPEPDDTTRRGIFFKIWSFLWNLFQRPFLKTIAPSSTFASMSNDNDTINRTLFFGTEQATSINQNPIVAVFNSDSQQLIWCYNSYEIAGADGRAIGALHAQVATSSTSNSHTTANDTNNEVLYVVFTIDGTQGTSAEDFRRFTTNGWIPSYGTGGGPKVSVVTQINITTGAPITGTFLRSQLLSNGRTNSLIVTQMSYERNCNVTATSGSSNDASLFQLRIQAEAYYLPMSLDGRTPLSESDCLPDTNSPFNYTVTLSPSLNVAHTADCRTIESTLPSTNNC